MNIERFCVLWLPGSTEITASKNDFFAAFPHYIVSQKRRVKLINFWNLHAPERYGKTLKGSSFCVNNKSDATFEWNQDLLNKPVRNNANVNGSHNNTYRHRTAAFQDGRKPVQNWTLVPARLYQTISRIISLLPRTPIFLRNPPLPSANETIVDVKRRGTYTKLQPQTVTSSRNVAV